MQHNSKTPICKTQCPVVSISEYTYTGEGLLNQTLQMQVKVTAWLRHNDWPDCELGHPWFSTNSTDNVQTTAFRSRSPAVTISLARVIRTGAFSQYCWINNTLPLPEGSVTYIIVGYSCLVRDAYRYVTYVYTWMHIYVICYLPYIANQQYAIIHQQSWSLFKTRYGTMVVYNYRWISMIDNCTQIFLGFNNWKSDFMYLEMNTRRNTDRKF